MHKNWSEAVSPKQKRSEPQAVHITAQSVLDDMYLPESAYFERNMEKRSSACKAWFPIKN